MGADSDAFSIAVTNTDAIRLKTGPTNSGVVALPKTP